MGLFAKVRLFEDLPSAYAELVASEPARHFPVRPRRSGGGLGGGVDLPVARVTGDRVTLLIDARAADALDKHAPD